MIRSNPARAALAIAAIAGLLPVAVKAADPTVDFAREIQPIFQERCLACHGSRAQMHGFRLDRRSDAFRGGDSGVPAIVPGNSADSLLLRYVSGGDPEVVMPPEGPALTGEQVELLRRWINEGAVWPQEENSSESQHGVNDHWAFQPVSAPALPTVEAKDWVRNPIDAFILEKLEAKGWKPSPAAEPHQLLRRLYLNLIGLPPNLAEQASFLKDPSEAAYKATIDDLLARPAYGERWARHWLDLVRYAESNGYERDRAKPHVWKYRDYVIRSFNRDKPFDRFVLEQLAGDELPDASAETLIATGYFRLGPWDDEPADPETDRFDQLDDIVSTTSQVFLGLTLGCARCHNHKFDPLTARDYYSMVAVFNGLQRPRDYRTELDLPIGTPRQLEQYRATSQRIERLQEELDRLRAILRRNFLESGRSNLPALAVQAFLARDPGRKQKGLRLIFEKQLAEEVEQRPRAGSRPGAIGGRGTEDPGAGGRPNRPAPRLFHARAGSVPARHPSVDPGQRRQSGTGSHAGLPGHSVGYGLSAGAAEQEQRAPAGPGSMAGRSSQPTDRPGDRQPHLAKALRIRAGSERQRFRHERREADPPPTAGLAGSLVRAGRVVLQEVPPPDSLQQQLPHEPQVESSLRRGRS